MSNPAVRKLCMTTIAGMPMWMDDNIGESIHVHFGDLRIDLTNKEFEKICEDICTAINQLVQVEGFDMHNINPVYMEVMLWKNIHYLEYIRYDTVALKEMLCPDVGIYKPIPDSKCVKALDGETKENDVPRLSHHLGQSSQDRLERVYNSILKYDYPYQNEYIVMYGDDNVIQDGQHRAACLWKIKGDVSVPVMRLYFKNYKSPSKKILSKNRSIIPAEIRGILFMIKEPRYFVRQLLKKIRRSLKGFIKRAIMRIYILKHKKIFEEYSSIFDLK